MCGGRCRWHLIASGAFGFKRSKPNGLHRHVQCFGIAGNTPAAKFNIYFAVGFVDQGVVVPSKQPQHRVIGNIYHIRLYHPYIPAIAYHIVRNHLRAIPAIVVELADIEVQVATVVEVSRAEVFAEVIWARTKQLSAPFDRPGAAAKIQLIARTPLWRWGRFDGTAGQKRTGQQGQKRKALLFHVTI